MRVEIDNEDHCGEFIRLNEVWIEEHFSLEEADRTLAEDPYRIVRDGGHILGLVVDGRVVGATRSREPGRDPQDDVARRLRLRPARGSPCRRG